MTTDRSPLAQQLQDKLGTHASGAKLSAMKGSLHVTQFADDALALTAHGCALMLKPADARFLARVLAAMYLTGEAS